MHGEADALLTCLHSSCFTVLTDTAGAAQRQHLNEKAAYPPFPGFSTQLLLTLYCRSNLR
jgi:hypothetical protein